MKIKINRNILLAMHTLTSRDESRYVLHGVNIEVSKRGECYVIATDGRRLAAIKAGEVLDSPEKKTSVIVPINTAMLRALPKSDVIPGDVIITFSEKFATFTTFGKNSKFTSFQSELIEGTFPKWREVIPKGNVALPIKPTFNWKLLDGFSKAADMIAGKRDAGITVRQADENACMLILMQSIPEFVGALMPMRSYSENQAPDWATEEEEAPKATEPAKAIETAATPAA